MNKSLSRASVPQSALKDGFGAGWPICLGYIPIGLALGVLAQKAGLTPLEVGFMSVFVFAGSSQFIAVSMISGGAAAGAIIATTFMVNLRHMLMSSALAVYLAAASRAKLGVYAYGVTDESFAVNHPRFHAGGWDLNRALVVNHVANLTWFISTVVGSYGGQFIPEHAMGIDYALIAMFICLLIYQFNGLIYWVTAAMAGAVAVALSLWIPGNAYIVLASLIAATAGTLIRRWVRKRDTP